MEYFLGDQLGSTSLTTDNTGVKVSEIKYKPWGEVRSAWYNPDLNNPQKPEKNTSPTYALTKYTFTGQYSYMDDPTTGNVTEGFGLMFYNARFYDPYLNQFTQPDSIIPQQYDPQSWNRYEYAENNPVRYNDPSGHVSCQGANMDDGPQCYNAQEVQNLEQSMSTRYQ